MKEAIREEFLKDWIHQASTEEIVEKLIQNDERAKAINKAIEYINKNIAIYHKQLPLIAIDYEEVINILKGETNEKSKIK